jgi:hypothetical protein
MFEVSDSVPSFSFNSEHMDYCNPQLYLNTEEPTEVFYTFDTLHATEMWYYSLTNEQQELRHLEDEERYNVLFQRYSNSDAVLSIKNDIVRKDAFAQSYNLNDINNDIYKHTKDFFKEIESVANLVFIDITDSERLQPNHLNIAFASFKNADFEDTAGTVLSAMILPSKNITFPGVVVTVKELNSMHYKSYILKILKHEILHGLCEAHPSFDNYQEEQKYRSLVEDISSSFFLHKSCYEKNGRIYYTKCASKHEVNTRYSNYKNDESFNRCFEASVDKKCLHLPNNLTPIDVKHLQDAFGVSKKEIDDSGFRKKFEEKYPEYIKESCSSRADGAEI